MGTAADIAARVRVVGRASSKKGSANLDVARGRVADRVGIRRESFGAIAYVPTRDHFFALDDRHAAVVRHLIDRWRVVVGPDAARLRHLAELGICETDPPTPQRAFFGRSLVGEFPDGLPAVARPMVVNCFATAHCPLRCAYCHADDLMTRRDAETDADLRRVERLARATSAMVAVVTGGEPLIRPDRAERLIRALGPSKALVLDTSGVGDLPRLLPLLREHHVHVRVSVDSADAVVNDRSRPISRRYLPPGTSSFVNAKDAIRRLVDAGIPCSVQSVVHARNADLDALLRLRDLVAGWGVTTWVLHTLVPAGKAALPGRARHLSAPDPRAVLDGLVSRTIADGTAVDVRVTSTQKKPNSVLLISADGKLSVENADGSGKTQVAVPPLLAGMRLRRHYRKLVDAEGHASRYLSGGLPAHLHGTGAVLPNA